MVADWFWSKSDLSFIFGGAKEVGEEVERWMKR